MITFGLAKGEDAEEIALILRRSITELCLPDHKNDAGEVAAWAANKTPET